MLYYTFCNMSPGAFEKSPTLKKMQYSKMRTNSELFFEAMPTESPTFKRRNLLCSFNRAEDADYLAEEPIEDQKAKVKRHMELEMASIA